MNGGYRMPSRVNAIKWLAVMQLIHGILIFIISIVLFAIDKEASVRTTVPVVGSGEFIIWTIPGFILAFLAIGAGVAGSSMSRYEGLIHNVSSKNACLALSVMNAFAALMYMAVEGTVWFYEVDQSQTSLGNRPNTWKASFAMVVIIFILAFFDMIVAFMTVILSALWLPRENNSSPGPYVSEQRMDEPYVVREERVPHSRSHLGVYGRSYPQDYYSGGYRTGTLPALKY